ncbi:MAG: VOC family protein [Tractidigestivibacter sp.]|jgi:lactoylglutathione lyase|uniref:VOC family protein n=1 Tax=Tractidigestivibacter sp. TaxID=2847320 RepID=UPI003D90C174
MRIEHVALYVNDLEGARSFFQKFFGATAGEQYHNPKTGFRSYFLSFEDGARLEVMSKEGIRDDAKEPERTGYAHVAFSVGSAQKVDELTAQLKDAGYQVVSGPRTTGDGYYESCVLGPEDLRVEITV